MAYAARTLQSLAASCASVFLLAACDPKDEAPIAPVAASAPASAPATPAAASSGYPSITKDTVHKGDLIVDTVGKGVKLTVKDGGLKVLGKVEDGAVIDQQGGGGGLVIIGQNVTISGDGGTIVMSSSGANSPNIIAGNVGGSITINGVEVKPEANASKLSGVEILGQAGAKVTIISTTTVKMKSTGPDSFISAGNGVTMLDAGKNSIVRAGNSLLGGIFGEGAQVSAGNSMNAGGFCARTVVSAGNSLSAQFAHPTARIRSGNGTQILGAEPRGCELL